MTNKERYKQAFSSLHASRSISLEETTMKKSNLKFHLRPALAACLAAAAIVGCMGVAYAANVGGIQETIRIWFNGEQVEADVVDITGTGDGGYQFNLHPGSGGDVDSTTISGGGIAIEDDGTQRPLTAQEVAEQFDGVVDTGEDGRVYIYDRDKAVDITDHLTEGKCKVVLEVDGKNVYYTIEDNGGGGWSYTRTYAPKDPVEDYIKLD